MISDTDLRLWWFAVVLALVVVLVVAVLLEFGIRYRAMMIHDIGGTLILAQHDVRRIAHRCAVEAIRMNFGAADNRVRGVIVFRV